MLFHPAILQLTSELQITICRATLKIAYFLSKSQILTKAIHYSPFSEHRAAGTDARRDAPPFRTVAKLKLHPKDAGDMPVLRFKTQRSQHA